MAPSGSPALPGRQPHSANGCAGKLRRIPPGFGPDGWGLMATARLAVNVSYEREADVAYHFNFIIHPY